MARSGAGRSAPAAGRDQRVDMLRALALMSMFVAHCAPGDGPFKILGLSEYATAPLFALLIGIGAALADRGNRALPSAFVRAGIRAAVLVALGLWLTTWGAQIDIVLTYLALPTVLAPALARLPSSALLVVSVVCWAANPPVMTWARTKQLDALVHGDELSGRLWEAIAAGVHYRLTTLLVFTCLGIVIWRLVAASAQRSRLAGLGTLALAVALVLMVAQMAGRISFEPYSGTRPEVAFTALLVAGASLVWFGIVPAHARFTPLAAAGAMTLSVYVAQIAYLAWYVRSLHPGRSDDSWANIVILCVGAIVLPMIWRGQVTREPWRKGPIEGPTALVTGLFR